MLALLFGNGPESDSPVSAPSRTSFAAVRRCSPLFAAGALLALLPEPALAQGAASPSPILNKLVAVYPCGATGTIAATPDGNVCYLGVTRVGVEVLKFKLDASGASLTSETLIQTPGEMGSVQIRDVVDPLGSGARRLLFVADYPFGLRVYDYSY